VIGKLIVSFSFTDTLGGLVAVYYRHLEDHEYGMVVYRL
jgi:hypothetical protein